MIGIGIIKKVFIVVLALIVLIQFELIIALFNSEWDTNTLLFIIPFLTLLIGCILLWMNNKIGLVILALYSTYAGVALFAAGIIRLIIFVSADSITNSHVTYMLFPTFNAALQALVGALFLFLGWTVSRGKLLEDSELNKNVVYRVISIISVVALLLTFK